VKCFFIFIFKNWFSLRVIFFLWNTFIIVKLIRNKIVRTCFLCHRTIIILSLKKIFKWNAFLSFSKKLKGSYEHALGKEEIIHISVFWYFSTCFIVIFTFYQGWFDNFKFFHIILKKLLMDPRIMTSTSFKWCMMNRTMGKVLLSSWFWECRVILFSTIVWPVFMEEVWLSCGEGL
jgi:hypothetical protein